ncbi:MAG TPA: hypothetical protein VM327_03875 [Candidatus Thermoplasmatota archaeon]|nr:hypothetical protein [Candidatus Thermoplasmatota archaeon]
MLLLAALAGGLWWTASIGAGDGDAPPSGPFQVFVVGPEGTLVANGTVLARGTPFDALRSLSDERGFEVEAEQQTWIGAGCTATYVAGIAGQRETSNGGWNYYTRAAGELQWTWGAAGAACHRLSPGDQVEWCWVESDVCRHHVA